MLRRRSAFTLIELLVVITILAVLAGLLLPAIAIAMDSSRKAQCASNLRQIGIAATGYQGDNNEHLPFFYPERGGPRHLLGLEGYSLEYALGEYMDGIRPAWNQASGSRVFFCKASPIRGVMQHSGQKKWNYSGAPSAGYNGYEGAMHYNYYDAARVVDAPTTAPIANYLSTQNFSRPSQTPYQFCSNRMYVIGAQVGGFQGLQGRSYHRDYKRPTLFLDGHVKVLGTLPYIMGGGNLLYHTDQMLKKGVYSTYELAWGIAYAGKPQHAPGDFWIEEY